MNARFLRFAGLSFALSAMLFLGACHKKSAAVTPPQTPPPAPKPTATLTASPTNLQRGQSVQLTWNTENATGVSIDTLGSVAPSGTRDVVPSESATYTLTATGPGGTVQATARVTVTAPPVPVVPAQAGPSDLELFQRNVKDIYFDYDRYDVRPADGTVLKADADFLAAHPGYKLIISGHCDERGSEDYNMALGSSRADGVRDQLAGLGIGRERIKTISYGKEKPFCTEQNEQCWQQNRRAHFSLDQ
jgi:peptidoglycan-associated lipoprotein